MFPNNVPLLHSPIIATKYIYSCETHTRDICWLKFWFESTFYFASYRRINRQMYCTEVCKTEREMIFWCESHWKKYTHRQRSGQSERALNLFVHSFECAMPRHLASSVISFFFFFDYANGIILNIFTILIECSQIICMFRFGLNVCTTSSIVQYAQYNNVLLQLWKYVCYRVERRRNNNIKRNISYYNFERNYQFYIYIRIELPLHQGLFWLEHKLNIEAFYELCLNCTVMHFLTAQSDRPCNMVFQI
jgi:hypothetical protein